MVYKSKNKFFKFIDLAACSIIIILAISFTSCSDDNPVKPTQVSEFDSARFNWRTVQIPYQGFAGIWAMDTGKIFLVNHYNYLLYTVTGGVVTEHSFGSYFVSEIEGISNNEVYLFGAEINGNNTVMSIIKWNGGNFEYFQTNIYPSDSRFIRGCVVNSNEIWMLSQGGIAKFDGSNMRYYTYEDSQLVPIRLFRTINNKIQYIATYGTDTTITQSLFEFQDTGFVRIYNDSNRINPPRYYTFLREMNGIKFGEYWNEPIEIPGSVCMKYFTGSSFSDYFCFNNKIHAPGIFLPGYPVGVDLQNFMFIVEAPPLERFLILQV